MANGHRSASARPETGSHLSLAHSEKPIVPIVFVPEGALNLAEHEALRDVVATLDAAIRRLPHGSRWRREFEATARLYQAATVLKGRKASPPRLALVDA